MKINMPEYGPASFIARGWQFSEPRQCRPLPGLTTQRCPNAQLPLRVCPTRPLRFYRHKGIRTTARSLFTGLAMIFRWAKPRATQTSISRWRLFARYQGSLSVDSLCQSPMLRGHSRIGPTIAPSKRSSFHEGCLATVSLVRLVIMAIHIRDRQLDFVDQ